MAPEVERAAPLWTFDRPPQQPKPQQMGRFGQPGVRKALHLHEILQSLVQSGQFTLDLYYPLQTYS
jgi:hypothetical protein